MAASGDSPAIARRRVRLAVRDARLAKGDTQSEVADAMEWSLSKVMRIESGEVTISPNDLRPLLIYLGLRKSEVVDDLIQAAKASKVRRRQWWEEPRFHDKVASNGRSEAILTPAMRQLIQYEAEATEARYFSVAVIPGRLQTDAYARQILSNYAAVYSNVLSEETLALRLEARARRREQLLSRRKHTKIYLLLDESVLMRQIVNRRVMGEQLSVLAGYADEGWLAVRIAPLIKPAPLMGTFELLYLGADDARNAVMYRESELQDELLDEQSITTPHRLVWERVWSSAVDEDTSTHLLHSRGEWFLEENGNNPEGTNTPGIYRER
jgi:transcriptional regulator with XRE-family HTH domain